MGRTYFDLCNDVLEELVYETVDEFEELEGITEGKKVKRDLNFALRFICNNEALSWKFRKVDKVFPLVKGIKNYDMPNGFIRYFKYCDVPIVLNYIEEHDSLPENTCGMPTSYWIENNKIVMYPTPDETQDNRLIRVEYNTYDCAVDCAGVYKPKMENACDEPIIPEHHRDILVWKVCADWRGNVSDARAAYYTKKYKDAYKALLMDQRQSEQYPNKLDIMGYTNTPQRSIMEAFYNPYTRRIY